MVASLYRREQPRRAAPNLETRGENKERGGAGCSRARSTGELMETTASNGPHCGQATENPAAALIDTIKPKARTSRLAAMLAQQDLQNKCAAWHIMCSCTLSQVASAGRPSSSMLAGIAFAMPTPVDGPVTSSFEVNLISVCLTEPRLPSIDTRDISNMCACIVAAARAAAHTPRLFTLAVI